MVREDNEEIVEADDLQGKKIGVQNGTTGDFEAADIEGAEVARYNNAIEAVLDLKNGDIDGVIVDNLPAQVLAEQNPEVKILDIKLAEDEEYALAVRKGDTELQQIINEGAKRNERKRRN